LPTFPKAGWASQTIRVGTAKECVFTHLASKGEDPRYASWNKVSPGEHGFTPDHMQLYLMGEGQLNMCHSQGIQR